MALAKPVLQVWLELYYSCFQVTTFLLANPTPDSSKGHNNNFNIVLLLCIWFSEHKILISTVIKDYTDNDVTCMEMLVSICKEQYPCTKQMTQVNKLCPSNRIILLINYYSLKPHNLLPNDYQKNSISETIVGTHTSNNSSTQSYYSYVFILLECTTVR